MKSQHIGIVTCSAEGAALCYRTVCVDGQELLGRHSHPEVSMHNHALGVYMDAIYNNDWQTVGVLMLDSAAKLKKIGADFVICPDNTIHHGLDLVRDKSPLPWLHIAEVVAEEAAARKFKKVGLTGTKYLMEGPVYPPKFKARGIEQLLPSEQQRGHINDIIFDELVNGKFLPASLTYFQSVINDLKSQGCQAVALSCTEIPLLVTPEVSALPTLDSTRLLARAALKRALANAKRDS